jgi:ABC-type glycerol-3-phosphate transport system substrate-binding protein
VDPKAPLTLTLWLPGDMVLDTPATVNVMNELYQTFAAANPRVRIEVVPKASSGQGGLVNMLLTTRPVAPERLPDVVAIDLAELYQLDKGLLNPLDGLLPQASWDDLYPFAQQAAKVNGQRVAMPFQTDITFLVHNALFLYDPPRDWGSLVKAKTTCLLPAGAGDGSSADALMMQYLAQGVALRQEAGRPYLDATALARVLRDYRAAVEAGVVPVTARNLRTLDDCWALYLRGGVGMTYASSAHFARDRGILPLARYAPIPAAGGPAVTLARTWAWAIVTHDPVRQEVAARFIVAALQPAHQAAWVAASYHLPTQVSVLRTTIADRSYYAFLDEQLQRAQPYPNLREYAQVQDAVAVAIEDVLDGVSTPERAAVTAAAMLTRLR